MFIVYNADREEIIAFTDTYDFALQLVENHLKDDSINVEEEVEIFKAEYIGTARLKLKITLEKEPDRYEDYNHNEGGGEFT